MIKIKIILILILMLEIEDASIKFLIGKKNKFFYF